MAEKKAADDKAQESKPSTRKVESAEEVRELGKANLPVGDHITVGGAADAPGDALEVHIVDSNGTDEVYVTTDRVVTDPLGPEGVVIPSAAIVDVVLPIHAVLNGTPEEQLARGENKSETSIVSGE